MPHLDDETIRAFQSGGAGGNDLGAQKDAAGLEQSPEKTGGSESAGWSGLAFSYVTISVNGSLEPLKFCCGTSMRSIIVRNRRFICVPTGYAT